MRAAKLSTSWEGSPPTTGRPRRVPLFRCESGRYISRVPDHRAVITSIVLIRAEPASIPATAQFLAEIDGVTDVYSVSGDWDLVAIVKVAEYDQIARVVTENFPKVPGLQRTQTLTAFRAYSKKDLQQAWDIGVE